MVDILERTDAECNKSNPAKANFRQEQAEQSTNQPSQGTSTVIQPGLHLWQRGRSFIDILISQRQDTPAFVGDMPLTLTTI